MREPEIGESVYFKEPQSFVSDCVSITGELIDIIEQSGKLYGIVNGYVAKYGEGYEIEVMVPFSNLGLRIGTPVSKLSVIPGTPGYAEWCRISNSWGYN
jgi:hypothetical protein